MRHFLAAPRSGRGSHARLFCELACLAANLNGRIRSDAKIRGLLGEAVCVNSLFFRRVYKVEPKNHLFLVWQDDVERIAVVPPLRLIGAPVEPLERLSGWGGLRKEQAAATIQSAQESVSEAADYCLCFATLKSVKLFA
jgi:hypothetical protein